MLFMIGLGLGGADDITVKGLKCIKASEKVFLENYTSVLCAGQQELEQMYGKKLILADREMVEQQSDLILDEAVDKNVAFLVVGDPFGATTHTDLYMRAQQRGIETTIVHNTSIINAVGCCGLQLYRFGETVSIVMWEDNWKPQCFYDKIVSNKERGLHTLCLLDIKMKEQTVENIIKQRAIYEPPRFMSVSDACKQLMEVVEKRGDGVITPDTHVIGLARVGSETQKLCSATLTSMTSYDLGPPLHSLIIVGDMHPLEKEMVEFLAGKI